MYKFLKIESEQFFLIMSKLKFFDYIEIFCSLTQSLKKILAKARARHAPLTIGEHLSPIIAAFLTMPLKPFVYSVLIRVWFQARKYEHVQIKSTTHTINASKLNMNV